MMECKKMVAFTLGLKFSREKNRSQGMNELNFIYILDLVHPVEKRHEAFITIQNMEI